MVHVALFEPEIPQNTGNIIRLCANTGSVLHLIHPLGFEWDDKRVKRAGLDYHELAAIKHYQTIQAFCEAHHDRRIFAMTTKGQQCYSSVQYQADDILLFGPETRGLPESLRTPPTITQSVFLPMQPDSRSLNLSNAVAVAVYEAWRQLDFILK